MARTTAPTQFEGAGGIIASPLPEANEAPEGQSAGWGVPRLTALFAAEVLALSAINLPAALRFRYVAFEDLGGTLIVQRLLDDGLRPAIDFYYPYGLLPLLAGRGWFAILGRSPGAYYAAVVACNLLVAWALARFSRALRIRPIAVALMVAAMPQALRIVQLNLTHAIEAALLCHALAYQALGKRRSALALATACAFVKPTMAYVYGFLLLLLITRDLWRRRAPIIGWLRAIAPACVVGLASLAAIVAAYGVRPLLAIQVPTQGGQSYKIMGYGFFHGQGRAFLMPKEGVGPGYYVGTYAGVWAIVSLIVLAGGLFAAGRLAARMGVREAGEGEDREGDRDEVVATCAALHAAFVCLFYGVSWDWLSYFLIPMMGLLAMIGRGRAWTIATGLLILLALTGHRLWALDHASSWRKQSRSPITAGLWSDEAERREWAEVVAATRGRKALLVKLSGCAETLFDGFEGTGTWYLHPKMFEPLSPPAEVERVTSRIEDAPALVVAKRGEDTLIHLPRFRETMARHRRVFQGEHFDVYLRDEPAAEAPPEADRPGSARSSPPGSHRQARPSGGS